VQLKDVINKKNRQISIISKNSTLHAIVPYTIIKSFLKGLVHTNLYSAAKNKIRFNISKTTCPRILSFLVIIYYAIISTPQQ